MLQQSQTNTTNRDQYNGWSNKETWLINLWINNDPYLVECLQDIVSYDDGIYAKVQMLKELVEYTVFGFNNQPAGMNSDLLNTAIDRANLGEIIESNSES